MYSASIANRKQATIFETNVPTTNGVPPTDGINMSKTRRQPTPKKPPTNTTTYITTSASGLNRACTRFIGASGICGGFFDAAAPDGWTDACATSLISIDCVAGFGSVPAFTSAGPSSVFRFCDSITLPCIGMRRTALFRPEAVQQRAGRSCRLPNPDKFTRWLNPPTLSVRFWGNGRTSSPHTTSRDQFWGNGRSDL